MAPTVPSSPKVFSAASCLAVERALGNARDAIMQRSEKMALAESSHVTENHIHRAIAAIGENLSQLMLPQQPEEIDLMKVTGSYAHPEDPES